MCVYKNFELVRFIPLIGNPLSLEFIDSNILCTICYNNIVFYDLRESPRNGFINRFQPSTDTCTSLAYNNNKLYVSCSNVLYQVDKSFQKTNEMINIPFKENIIGIYPLNNSEESSADNDRVILVGDCNEIYIKNNEKEKEKKNSKTLEENHKLCYRTASPIVGCSIQNNALNCLSSNGDIYKMKI